MSNKIDRNDFLIALGILLDSNESVRCAILATQANPVLDPKERGKLKAAAQEHANKAGRDFAMFMVGK